MTSKYASPTVRGYHGTTKRLADQIVESGSFRSSDNKGDWLGSGIYFFQDAPYRALEWARTKLKTPDDSPVVVAADISLESCLDLLDGDAMDQLIDVVPEFENYLSAHNLAPRQVAMRIENGKVKSGKRFGYNTTDKQFFDWIVGRIRRRGGVVTSVRAAFVEGDEVFDASFIYSKSHVQLAVLDHSALSNITLIDME